MGGKKADPNKAAREAQREQMARLDKLSIPDLKEYVLQNPDMVGLLSAEQIQATGLKDIQLDPALRDKQMAALQGMQERAEQGLTEQDKYAMEELVGNVAAGEKASRASIESEMARKGTADSGNALAMKLQAAQSGGNNARKQAMQMAAQGQQNKMQALQQMGQMAGQMDAADYSRQANAATAQDAISRANAMNKQSVNAQNLAARQQHENQRANIANQNMQVSNQIAQQNYNNQLSKAGAQGQAANSVGPSAPQGPSGFQQLATIGGAVAGGMAGGPGGIAAGAQAGASLGGMFEDGGIAQSYNFENGGIAAGAQADGGVSAAYAERMADNQRRELEASKAANKEKKAHEKFKSGYMKQVRDELAPTDPKKKEQKVPEVHAENGAIAGNQFFNADKMNQDLVKASQGEQIDGMKVLGRNTDVTAPEVQTSQQAEELLSVDKGLSLDPAAIKAVGDVAGLLNPKQEAAPAQPVGQANYTQPENVLGGVQVPQFADGGMVMSAEEMERMIASGEAQDVTKAFEDGGIIPNYECGGIHKGTNYQDGGEVSFDSTGESAVVGGDSFERDRVDAKLNSGEMVLNVAQQQRLNDLLQGKIALDELGSEDIVEGVPADYQEDLVDEAGEGRDLGALLAGLKGE